MCLVKSMHKKQTEKNEFAQSLEFVFALLWQECTDILISKCFDFSIGVQYSQGRFMIIPY